MYDFSVLRSLRKQHQLTIEEAARASAISPAVISRLERNQTAADLETLFRLGRAFGMTATDLLALTEKRTSQRVKATSHLSGDFHFQEVLYGNVRCLLGSAAKGAKLSRPEIHQDDYEVCWVLSGTVRLGLPHETHELHGGEALQFDAVLHHTYEALQDSQLIVLHLRKGKRF